MTVQLSEEVMRPLVAKAILDTLTAEDKERLVSDAVAHLLTPTKPQYSSGPTKTPLQSAMEVAAQQALMQVARERVESDPVLGEKISAMVGAAVEEIVKGDFDLVQEVGRAVGAAVAAHMREKRGW